MEKPLDLVPSFVVYLPAAHVIALVEQDPFFLRLNKIHSSSPESAHHHRAIFFSSSAILLRLQNHLSVAGICSSPPHRIFPSFDYRWLLDEMSESLLCCFLFFFINVIFHQKLYILVEAKNSEKCLDNFRKLSPHIAEYVYAPRVYWNLSCARE